MKSAPALFALALFAALLAPPAHAQTLLSASDLRASMLRSDSVQVARVVVDVVETVDNEGHTRSSLETSKVSINQVRGPWMKRFVAQFLPDSAATRAELCPTPLPPAGQDKAWMVSVLWINPAGERGQTYVDFSNRCAFAGIAGHAPVGLDVAPARVDSIFALFQQALFADSVLRVMKAPAPAAAAVGSAADAPPQPMKKVMPVYSDSLKALGLQGTVKVRALVGPAGDVQDVAIDQSVKGLDDAALEAVRQWRFKPAHQRGRAVAAWVVVPVEFTLSPKPAEKRR